MTYFSVEFLDIKTAKKTIKTSKNTRTAVKVACHVLRDKITEKINETKGRKITASVIEDITVDALVKILEGDY